MLPASGKAPTNHSRTCLACLSRMKSKSGVVETICHPRMQRQKRSNHAPRIEQGVKRRQHASQPMHSFWRITNPLNFAQNQE